MTILTRQRLLAVVGGAALAAFALGFARAQPADADVSEVVVTGSHLRRALEAGSSESVSVSGQEIRTSGYLSVGDMLQAMPMMVANINQQRASAFSYLAGQTRINLRGLGAARTLVLQDGRRTPFTDASDPAVDINIFPALMVERVDVVPGGASAIYGSEAVAGVVNVIMRQRMDGFEGDAQAGVSRHGDGEEFRLGAVWGRKLMGQRLNLVVGGEVTRSGMIMQRDRDNLYPGLSRSGTVPQTVVPNPATSQSPYATFQLGTGRAVAIDVRNPSQLSLLSPACSTVPVQPACQDPALTYNTSYLPLQGRANRAVFRAYADYDLGDRMQVFGEANFARIEGYVTNTPAFSTTSGATPMPISISQDNAFLLATGSLAAQLRAQIAAAGLAPAARINVGKYFGEFGGRDVDARRDITRLAGGVRGDVGALGHSFHWNAYAQHSRTDGRVVSPGVPNIVRLQQAVDAIVVNGQAVCRSAAAQAAGCVPFDLINGASPAAIAWTNGVSYADQDVRQTAAAFDVAGDIVDLPAGAISLAAGVEYRRERSSFSQDAITASGALFQTPTGVRAGRYSVREGYGELRLPLLKNLPFAQELSVEGAYRTADYSSTGRANQHRLAAVWAPVADIRIRASRGTTVRAPNIVELYAPQAASFITQAADPCDRLSMAVASAAQRALRQVTCAAAIPGYNAATFVSNIQLGRAPGLRTILGGNPNLGPETGHTYQIGLDVRPRFAPDLKVSWDFFRYNLREGVSSVPLQALVPLCYDAAVAYEANPYCALIIRDPNGGAAAGGIRGGLVEVRTNNQNLSSIKVEGYDAAVEYRLRTGDLGRDWGDFLARVHVTRMYRYIVQGLPGQAYVRFAGAVDGQPEWQATASLDWTRGRWSAAWTGGFVGSMILSNSIPPTAYIPYTTGDHWTHDLRAAYRFSDILTLRGGVLNVTDKYPPALPETYNGVLNNSAGMYDNRGRYFYVGVNLKY